MGDDYTRAIIRAFLVAELKEAGFIHAQPHALELLLDAVIVFVARRARDVAQIPVLGGRTSANAQDVLAGVELCSCKAETLGSLCAFAREAVHRPFEYLVEEYPEPSEPGWMTELVGVDEMIPCRPRIFGGRSRAEAAHVPAWFPVFPSGLGMPAPPAPFVRTEVDHVVDPRDGDDIRAALAALSQPEVGAGVDLECSLCDVPVACYAVPTGALPGFGCSRGAALAFDPQFPPRVELTPEVMGISARDQIANLSLLSIHHGVRDPGNYKDASVVVPPAGRAKPQPAVTRAASRISSTGEAEGNG